MKRWKHRLLAGVLTAALCLTTAPAALAVSAYDCPEQKLAALTFDDGPGPYSDTLMDILKKHNAKATFFMNGYKLNTYAPQVRRMVAEGHQVGNHTYNHPYLAKSSDAKIRSEVGSTAQLLTSITGLTGTGNTGFYLRPPYGSYNSHVAAVADVPVIWCSVDSGDWKYQNADRLVSYTGSVLKDGDIVVMHETHKTTAWGLDRLLDVLDAKGFTLVTVEELFWRRGIDPQPGTIYYSAAASKTGVNRCAKALWFDESRLDTHWAGEAIAFVRENGYMSGNLYGEFTPNFALTRGMFVTGLGRLSGVEAGVRDSGFTDVPPDHYAAPYAAWARENGIMEGAGDGTFQVDAPLTRQEMAAALGRYLRLSQPEESRSGEAPVYADWESIADWARDGVSFCGSMGVLTGYDGAFHPTETATRAMGAAILQRIAAYALPPSESETQREPAGVGEEAPAPDADGGEDISEAF